jgi:tetratricopeptide (TPR) repeat protein
MSALVLLVLLSVGSPPESEACDALCERRFAEELLERGALREAIERLAGAIERYPDDPALPLLLARGYLLDANPFWAEKTLRAALVTRPADPELRAWLTLVHLRQGDPDLASEALSAGPEPPAGPEQTRAKLLAAYRATLAGEQEEARSLLKGIGRAAAAFPEDRPVRDELARRLDPWWIEPASGEIELGGGSTSNALAGAPTDPGVAGTGSQLIDGTARFHFTAARSRSLRPLLDLEAKGHRNVDEDYRELSSLQASGRIGGTVNLGRYRLLAGYRAEVLHLDQDDSRFAEAHRGELELESVQGWLLFGGAGHRTYRDERWTRDEWDLGAGGPVRFGRGPSLAVGATVRGTSARSKAWDVRGASLAAATRIALPFHLSARLSATASFDDYLHSGGTEGLAAFGTSDKRRDLTTKATLGLWFPPWHGQRVGLEGQLARRDSTADGRAGFDFDYSESRVLLLVRFGFRGDPWAPRAVHSSDHVPLEWGLARGDGSETERIIDLLRQDEELRRGSSCGI